MRAIYMLIGVLLGVLLTTYKAHMVCERLEAAYQEDISTYTLVGYYEGWSRGRDYTRNILEWRLNSCISDANRLGRGKHK